VTWIDIEVRGKRAAFCGSGKIRLYVCERFGASEAWVAGDKIGNFASLDDAKAAASRRAGPAFSACAPSPQLERQ
jgi:hypothetical protein